jgi:ABC-type phosphate transport system permease subunit
MAESGLTMAGHSILIGLFIYLVLVCLMGVDQTVAENRSVMITGLCMAYMVVFGHKLPGQV